MVVKIKKGNHDANSIVDNFPYIYFFGNKTERVYSFNNTCRYTLNERDQEDINKLFGVSALSGVHKNSARFGWNYHPPTDSIRIFSYCYINGERKSELLGSTKINEPIRLKLEWKSSGVWFTVNGITSHAIPLVIKNPTIVNGLYFGGNNPALHDIVINRT